MTGCTGAQANGNGPIFTLEQLAPILPENGRLLGLDVGSKTIGLALSDTARCIASPLFVIRRTRFRDDVRRLDDIIDTHAIAALIVGMPYNMDASEGRRAQSTRAFAANVLRHRQIAIAFWDERLSSVAAERAMIDAHMSRAKRRAVIDKAAAAFILQGALDRLRSLP